MARRFDLVAFDVDGTLVTHPERKTIWEVLNRRFLGDDTVNAERHDAVRNGRMSYAEWVALDVQGWHDAGATQGDILEAIGSLRLVPGAQETVEALKHSGASLRVMSGTVDVVLDSLFPGHPFDEVYTNRIAFDDNGRISGWTATPFDMEGKGVALRTIAYRERIPLTRCAFVGDSSNDVHIARVAGFTVAFNPTSEALAREADTVVRGEDLRAILPHLL